jgi:hypothetical protein
VVVVVCLVVCVLESKNWIKKTLVNKKTKIPKGPNDGLPSSGPFPSWFADVGGRSSLSLFTL